MKKIITVLAVTLLPGLALGNGTAEMADLAQTRLALKPVVSVIALSPEQAQEFARVRSEYLNRKTQIDADHEAQLDYEAQLNAILTRHAADNS